MKTLETVTLTGADDSVSPHQLRELSEEFPFVEWGILIGSDSGHHRFPSLPWIANLIGEREKTNNTMKISLHICGRYLREIASGQSDLMRLLGPGLCAFSRCQLNWHAERQGQIAENILAAFCHLSPWEPTIIFQMDGVNGDLASGCIRRFRCAGLFDRSHGAGVKPDLWPLALTYMQSGWAGGLGPDNVAEESPKIAEVANQPFWIDMETKLFTGQRFDLDKCRCVLEAMAPHVK